MSQRPQSRDDYTVACICAKAYESATVTGMFDEDFGTPPHFQDEIAYRAGRIGLHKVVVVQLPEAGTDKAAAAVTQLKSEFRNIRFALLVGIGGGIPDATKDVRLGDVVVSRPTDKSPGVVQYDLGRSHSGDFKRTGSLNKPHKFLLSSLQKLESSHEQEDSKVNDHMKAMLERYSKMKEEYKYPGASQDLLFKANYKHQGQYPDCSKCNPSEKVERAERQDDNPVIHYGNIGSANRVVMDTEAREYLKRHEEILCVEMEAAGIMDAMSCLVIRGIADYADSHKGDKWKKYAAAAAAGFMKEFLLSVPGQDSRDKSLLEPMSSTIIDMSEMLEQSRIKQIFDWLGPFDQSQRQNEVRLAWEPGTGLWLTESKAFMDWKASNNVLWLHGIPGCGKTMLSTVMISSLMEDVVKKADATLIYFFFDFGKRSTQGCGDHLLRSLLAQIVFQKKICYKVLQKLFIDCAGFRKPNQNELVDALAEAIGQLSKVYVVIDALDECKDHEDRLRVIRILKDLDKRLPNLSMAVTSRAEPDLVRKLPEFVGDELAIAKNLVDGDIALYIQRRFESGDMNDWPEDIKTVVKQSLLSKANGMFLLVKCQLDRLESSCFMSNDEILAALNKLPDTLSDTYRQLLEDIIGRQDEEQTMRVVRIMACLAFSFRPMRLSELRDVVQITADGKMSASNQLAMVPGLFQRNLRIWCRSLILLEGPAERNEKEADTKEVQLAHLSIRDYLVSSSIKQTDSPVRRFALADGKGDRILAELCTTCILHFKNYDEFGPQSIERHPFLPYAGQYLGHHAKAANYQTDRSRLDDLLFDLLHTNHVAFVNWHRLCDPPNDQRGVRWQLPARTKDELVRHQHCWTPLFYCAHWNLYRIAERLLKAGHDPCGFTPGLRTPILMAIETRSRETVKVLLSFSKAIANVCDWEQITPLDTAVQKRYFDREIVEMLLDADADPRIPSNVVGTAIHEAAFSGNNEALTMLLDRGASPNAECEHDRQLTFKLATPLQCAAWECNFDGIDILLTRGAHINAVHNGDMGTALHAAAAAAHPKVMIHLLDRGADFRIRAGRCGSVLAAAGYGGNHEVILILLEKGATLDDFEDIKSSRSWHELDETARQALSKNIISHSKDAFCSSLIEAAKAGANNAAQRFLNEGEHKEHKVFATGRTALAYAAQNGHAETVKLLLENGSQIDNGDRWGNTPLHLAVFSGHLEIVKILVTHNTNVDCKNSYSETPLFLAKTRGRGEIVKYLESHSLH